MTLWRIATGVMAALFVAAAGLQWNDPDPIQWMAIYGAAAAAAACSASRPGSIVAGSIAVLTGAAALAWAVLLAPRAIEHLSPGLGRFEMMSPAVEETREFLGLLIVLAWMIAIVIVGRRHRAAGARLD